MDIPSESLYDLTITIKNETRTFNTFDQVINETSRTDEIEFFRITEERMKAEKKLRPAGVTVTETSNPKEIHTRTITHKVKLSK